MSNPTLPVKNVNPRRVLGRHPLRHLSVEQEFRTLLTGRLGAVDWKEKCMVSCVIDDKVVRLHPDVVVWAL